MTRFIAYLNIIGKVSGVVTFSHFQLYCDYKTYYVGNKQNDEHNVLFHFLEVVILAEGVVAPPY